MARPDRSLAGGHDGLRETVQRRAYLGTGRIYLYPKPRPTRWQRLAAFLRRWGIGVHRGT